MQLTISEWKKRPLFELNELLKNIYTQMIEYEKQCDYKNAELYRSGYERCYDYLKERQLDEMHSRHAKQVGELQDSRKNELHHLDQRWTQKLSEYNQECQKLHAEIKSRNDKEQQAKRLEMEQQLSTKVKQSNQLLNLRKMEQHAAKQRNFVEAHSIQQKVNKLYGEELDGWMAGRESKIQQALKNMRNRQDSELAGINNRIKMTLEDFAKDRFADETGTNQKFDNLLKQLKARHERQILSLHGELKNIGGQSPVRKSKSTIEHTTIKSPVRTKK